MISIIIPCFNAELTLRATVESAFAQDVDKEVIVVDDGSTDGTGDIIRSFGKQIRPAFGPNRGAGAARNIGTRLARGDFLQYLDSDDLLMVGTLPVRLQALQLSNADVAHTDWQELVEHADGSYKPGVVRHPPLELMAMDIQVATATSRFWAPPAALLYTRAIVESVGQWREISKSSRMPDFCSMLPRVVPASFTSPELVHSIASDRRASRAAAPRVSSKSASAIRRRSKGFGILTERRQEFAEMQFAKCGTVSRLPQRRKGLTVLPPRERATIE